MKWPSWPNEAALAVPGSLLILRQPGGYRSAAPIGIVATDQPAGARPGWSQPNSDDPARLAIVWDDVDELAGLDAVDEELDVPLPQPAATRATTTSAAPKSRRFALKEGLMVLQTAFCRRGFPGRLIGNTGSTGRNGPRRSAWQLCMPLRVARKLG